MRNPTDPVTRPSWRTVVRWPAFLLANVALLLIIGVSTIRETYQGWKVDQEIQAMDAQASSLEGNKVQLEMLTKELGSPDRVEYEARARLGMKKQGERVIVLEGVSASSSWSGDEDPLTAVAQPSDSQDDAVRSNPERWWAYFFSRKQS